MGVYNSTAIQVDTKIQKRSETFTMSRYPTKHEIIIMVLGHDDYVSHIVSYNELSKEAYDAYN
ncbi:MAG TPA: hypothetical protein VLG50_05135 [Candidatus Saccharimonadales bacterium]|nr:hypothetical protein [Candidatus Saccharimonadales bacterium]